MAKKVTANGTTQATGLAATTQGPANFGGNFRQETSNVSSVTAKAKAAPLPKKKK